MKARLSTHRLNTGYALLMVMAVTGVAALVIQDLRCTMTHAKLNLRSNEYNVTGNAAEAAVEKVVARMGVDFQNFGLVPVNGSMSQYQSSIPNEDSFWRVSVSRTAMGM